MTIPEALMLESETSFKAIFQHASVGILIISKDGCIELANPVAEQLFGYTHTELIGQQIELLMPVNIRPAHIQYRDQYFHGPQARPMAQEANLYARHKDGTSFPVEISLGHYSLNGTTLAIAFVTDITERKRAETQFKEESEWMRFLNKAMTRLWNIQNLEEGLKEILSSSMELLGTDKGNVQLLDPKQQCLRIAVQQGFGDEFLTHFKEVSAASNSVCGVAFSNRRQIVVDDVEKESFFAPHLHIARNAGFRSVQSTPLYNHEGLPIAMVSTHSPTPGHFDMQSLGRMDLYARYAESFLERVKDHNTIKKVNLGLEEKVKERTRELADALLRERELNHMKSAFVSMVSHEFRTPLSVILSSANLAERYTQTDQQDKREKHLARISSSTKHIVNLLDDFLSLGRLEEGKVRVDNEKFDLKELMQDIIAEFEGIKKKQQNINSTYTGPAEVQSDKKILRNILNNLLSNAIKYSDKDIDLKTVVTAQQIVLTIKDEGIGIPEEQHINMYSKFFRARNVGTIQGTGLGLSIVKLYIDLLNGNIGFTSRENAGTTFTVILPNGKWQ